MTSLARGLGRMTGWVTTYDRRRCYGYIASDHAGKFFFHADDLAEGSPRREPGTAVEFTPDPNAPRGPRASDVRLLASLSPPSGAA